MTNIFLHPENVYGQQALYPACPKSKLFCELCQTKTFTPHMVDKIQQLGYDISIQYNTDAKKQYKVT